MPLIRPRSRISRAELRMRALDAYSLRVPELPDRAPIQPWRCRILATGTR